MSQGSNPDGQRSVTCETLRAPKMRGKPNFKRSSRRNLPPGLLPIEPVADSVGGRFNVTALAPNNTRRQKNDRADSRIRFVGGHQNGDSLAVAQVDVEVGIATIQSQARIQLDRIALASPGCKSDRFPFEQARNPEASKNRKPRLAPVLRRRNPTPERPFPLTSVGRLTRQWRSGVAP